MKDGFRILIIGGYGTFGSRIVRLLENEARVTLIIAGRSLERAGAFQKSRGNVPAHLMAVRLDRDDPDEAIGSCHPDIVVDASGPFQAYGDKRYRLVEACIARRINYLDLADGSDIVAGITAFDARAKAAGIFVLSGASSFPVLTASVVRRLATGFARVETIRAGIAPSPYADIGENVIRAIASYAGQSTRIRRDGEDAIAFPLTDHMRFTIAPPGHLPLRQRLFSLVDAPDLRALAELWPDARTIWTGAAPVPAASHRVLILLAWAVRARLLPGLAFLAPLMRATRNRFRWGEHRGGMFVTISGKDGAGETVARSWHMVAEGDDGPFIPAMAVAALIHRLLDGRPPAWGARPATRDLELEDYEGLFLERSIRTGITDDVPIAADLLYKRLLGSAWDRLPTEIRAIHQLDGTASGRATVERGTGVLARLVAFVVGFPETAEDTPVTVRFDRSRDVETWTRTFGGRSFSSRQFAGRAKPDRLLCERFGPLTFAMALVLEGCRLSLVLRHWSAFGLTLPAFLCPRSVAYEAVADGRFQFHVEISHWMTGLIVRYRGWLEPT